MEKRYRERGLEINKREREMKKEGEGERGRQ